MDTLRVLIGAILLIMIFLGFVPFYFFFRAQLTTTYGYQSVIFSSIFIIVSIAVVSFLIHRRILIIPPLFPIDYNVLFPKQRNVRILSIIIWIIVLFLIIMFLISLFLAAIK